MPIFFFHPASVTSARFRNPSGFLDGVGAHVWMEFLDWIPGWLRDGSVQPRLIEVIQRTGPLYEHHPSEGWTPDEAN